MIFFFWSAWTDLENLPWKAQVFSKSVFTVFFWGNWLNCGFTDGFLRSAIESRPEPTVQRMLWPSQCSLFSDCRWMGQTMRTVHVLEPLLCWRRWDFPACWDWRDTHPILGCYREWGVGMQQMKLISHWEWQPTPIFLPGEHHGQKSLVGYSAWGCNWACMQQRATPCCTVPGKHENGYRMWVCVYESWVSLCEPVGVIVNLCVWRSACFLRSYFPLTQHDTPVKVLLKKKNFIITAHYLYSHSFFLHTGVPGNVDNILSPRMEMEQKTNGPSSWPLKGKSQNGNPGKGSNVDTLKHQPVLITQPQDHQSWVKRGPCFSDYFILSMIPIARKPKASFFHVFPFFSPLPSVHQHNAKPQFSLYLLTTHIHTHPSLFHSNELF